MKLGIERYLEGKNKPIIIAERKPKVKRLALQARKIITSIDNKGR